MLPGGQKMSPAHFLNAPSDHSSANIDGFDPEPHYDCDCQPFGRDKAAEKRISAGYLIDKERWRVMLFAEGRFKCDRVLPCGGNN